LRPGKPNSGIGVERSLPCDLENSRKVAVITAQTVWLPKSSALVLQQPSRKKPVIGFIEQISSPSPSTLRPARRLPPLVLSSLSIGSDLFWNHRRASAADFKFLQRLQQAREGT